MRACVRTCWGKRLKDRIGGRGFGEGEKSRVDGGGIFRYGIWLLCEDFFSFSAGDAGVLGTGRVSCLRVGVLI
jgi:hypothetical protein